MKWFKHDSNAGMNSKLKRLKIRYGLEGYGLYWYCLEIISEEVDQSNFTFELAHDAEIISYDTGLHIDHVQEMMEYMVKLGLFENEAGVITCSALGRRLDKSMTSNLELRRIIKELRDKTKVDSHNNHDIITTEEKRREEIRKDLNTRSKKQFDLFWSTYPKKVKRKKAVEIWKRRKLDDLTDLIITDVKTRLAKDDRWLNGYVPDPTTYLNGDLWEDAIIKPTIKNPELCSQSQILRVGSQLGLNARPGETMEDFASRVRTTRHDS